MDPLKNPDIDLIRKDERNKILDELDRRIMVRATELSEELQTLKTPKSQLVWERRMGLGEVLDMIEDIRQRDGGEQE